MVLALQIPGSLMVLVVNTSLCCIAIEAFALHHVGHALLKGSDDADVQDIALVGQDHLGGSSHDHHMPPCGSGPDNLFHGHAIDLAGKRFCRLVRISEMIPPLDSSCASASSRLVPSSLATRSTMAWSTTCQPRRPAMRAAISPPPLPYSREIVTARIRLMVSIASLFMIGSSSRGTLLLSGVTAHS